MNFIGKKEVINGEDIKLTIDSTLQNNSYTQLNGEKGAVTAVDPISGEVLALVSSPTYDSNMFTTYVSYTKAAEREARYALNYEKHREKTTDLKEER